MSSISLMPVGAKIKVIKEHKIVISNRNSTTKALEDSGMIIGNNIILDENTVIRIDGFSSQYSSKDYPTTRLTVFPDQRKSGKVDVSLKDLDGLVWGILEVAAKQPVKEVKRINIEYNDDNTNYKYNVWHQAFKHGYDLENDDIVVVNPLELTEDEIKNLEFSYERKTDVGSVVIKIGRKNWNYKLAIKQKFNFKLELSGVGLLSCKLDTIEKKLEYKEDNYYTSEFSPIDIDLNFNKNTVIKLIDRFFKDKHEF